MCKINVNVSQTSGSVASTGTGTGTGTTKDASPAVYFTEYDLSSYPYFKLDQEEGPICTRDKNLTPPLQFTKYKDYVGVRYNKECLTYQICQDPSRQDEGTASWVPKGNISTLGLFRSVYFHKGKLIAFAPPKSYNEYALHLPENMQSTSFGIEHFADGTLIMLAHNGEEWVKFTRSYVGAGNSFFKGQKSFAEMFDDACANVDLDVDTLDQRYCYAFVLQHKDNRIVTEIVNNTLCLVGIYECEGLKVKELHIMDNPHIQEIFRPTKIVTNMYVDQYQKILCDVQHYIGQRPVTLYDVIHHFRNIYTSSQTSHSIQGIVLRINGKRFKIWNPNYKYVRTLKGNEPNLQYQFYELRKNKLVNEYLRFYPEHTTYFNSLEEDIRNFAKRTQNVYFQVFIQKTMNIDDPSIPSSIKKQLKPLHHHYLSFLRHWRKVVSIPEVEHFIGTLASPQLMDIMNNKN